MKSTALESVFSPLVVLYLGLIRPNLPSSQLVLFSIPYPSPRSHPPPPTLMLPLGSLLRTTLPNLWMSLQLLPWSMWWPNSPTTF